MGRLGLLAGTGAVELAVETGEPMMGYGARRAPAAARHDPLHARALYLRGAGESLVVSLEVCLVAPVQADALRARIAARTGVAAERVTVSCIHTHSGPETGLLAVLSGRGEPPAAARLWDAAVEAAARAVETAAPARLGVGRAEARIGRNRRREDGPLDPTVEVVRVDRAGGAPLAVLYVHGCHPTALGHDNLAYSADWPWAAGERIARATGAMPIFLLGAHADVDPRTRGLLDLAVPGQSLGVGFDVVEALGAEVGHAVAVAAGGISTRADAPVGAAATRVVVPVHREEEADRQAALAALELPADARPGTAEWFRLEGERTAGLAPEERRARVARVRRYLRGHTAQRFAGGLAQGVQVQVLRLGPLRLLALPAEATVDVGAEWRRRVSEPASVTSIANGWLRYLPHPANYEEPLAEQKYEILMSALAPEAALLLVDAGERLAAGLDAALAERGAA